MCSQIQDHQICSSSHSKFEDVEMEDVSETPDKSNKENFNPSQVQNFVPLHWIGHSI